MTMDDAMKQLMTEYFKHLGMDLGIEEYAAESNEYFKSITSRKILVETKLNGDPNNLFSADAEVKTMYNDLTTKIVRAQEKALAWSEEQRQKGDLEKLKFMDPNTTPGWYQNLKGELFHYDGVIWDTVPNEKIKDLEYLG